MRGVRCDDGRRNHAFLEIYASVNDDVRHLRGGPIGSLLKAATLLEKTAKSTSCSFELFHLRKTRTPEQSWFNVSKKWII